MSGASAPLLSEHDREESAFSLAIPGRVSLLGSSRASTPEQMADLAKASAPDPTIFEEREPFFWSAEISSNRLDAYFTTMAPSTLKNFAADAEAGIAFMNSHRTGGFIGDAELPLGRSIAGRFVGAGGNGVAKTLADFYTLRGLALNGTAGPSTDQLLDGMRSGIVSDVSVGFYGGEVRCSICSRDMMRDWDCRHYPGREYEVVDSSGTPTADRVVAIGVIENAHLAEVSAVYDGATPGAQIVSLKAPRDIAEGRMRPETAAWLEQRFRIRLPTPARSFAGADIPAPAKEAEPMLTDEQIATIRLALTEAGAAPDADVPTAIRTLVDDVKAGRERAGEIERLKPFEAEAERLRPLADEGRQYRADLVEAAVTEGKRAMGTDFAEETYRGLLTSVPIETVKRMRDDWKAVGDKQFPGGRATTEGHQPPASTTNGAVPAAAFTG